MRSFGVPIPLLICPLFPCPQQQAPGAFAFKGKRREDPRPVLTRVPWVLQCLLRCSCAAHSRPHAAGLCWLLPVCGRAQGGARRRSLCSRPFKFITRLLLIRRQQTGVPDTP